MAYPTPQPRPRTDWLDWGIELTALFWSALSLMGMVLLLAFLDGYPIFEWKHITLNTIISILSVSMKAGLLFAVAELIGQWKWISFSRDARHLIDFERIDHASRGPAGGFRLLGTVKGLWPVRLGALIMILAIALDPFSQQLLQFEQGLVGANTIWPHAYAKRSERYIGGKLDSNTLQLEQGSSEPVLSVGTKLEESMQVAIKDGLYQLTNRSEVQSTTTCPADTCIWPRFDTLGVCQKCNDLTSDLKKVANFGEAYGAVYGVNEGEYDKKSSTAFALPNGHFLANINRCPMWSYERCSLSNSSGGYTSSFVVKTTTFGTGNPSMTNSMKDIDTLIWSMSFIDVDFEKMGTVTPRWPDVSVRATECALYYCVKSIDVKVEQNSPQENATQDTDAKRDPSSWNATFSHLYKENSSPENMPSRDELQSLEFGKDSADIRRTDLKLYYPNSPRYPEYSIDDSTVWSISAFFQGLLSDNITDSPSIRSALSDALPNEPVGLNGQILGSDRKFPPDLDAFQKSAGSDDPDIPAIFRSLARSMTDEMRINGFVGYPGRNIVDGMKWLVRDSYKAEWGWIALHGALLLGGVLLWCLTVWHSLRPSQRIPAWKNSSLAVISKGFKALGILMEADSVKQMKKNARKGMVKIPMDDHSTVSQTEHDGDLFEMQRAENREPPPYGAD